MGAGDEQADIEALRVTREESRAVLDLQLAQLNDLDDKAMWTVRTAIVLLGLLASMAGIVGTSVVAGLTGATLFGFTVAICGLFFTVFVGIGTYAVSSTPFGVGESHRREVQMAPYSERDWLDILLNEYDDWTRTMETAIETQATLVFWSQSLLALSMTSLFVAITLLAIGG